MAHPQMILVFGTDGFLVEEQVQNLLRELLPNAQSGDFSLETIQASVDKADDAVVALQAAQQAFLQTSFFATDKIVWLRGLNFSAGTDRLSKSQTVHDAIETFRTSLREKGLPAGVTLLISSTSLAKNSALYKSFQSMAKEKRAEIIETLGGDTNSARKLVGRFAEQMGFTIGAEAVQVLVDRVGTDGSTLKNECAKLFTYTNGKEPTPADVSAICTLHCDGEAWDLADAFGTRNLTDSIRILHDLIRLKAAPIMLIIVLEGRIADICLLADAREKGLLASSGSAWAQNLSAEDQAAVRDIAAADPLNKFGFAKNRILAQARLWSSRQAQDARRALFTCHETLTSSSVDPASVLEIALSKALS